MKKLQYSIFVADYNIHRPENCVIRIEKVATRKKHHAIFDAYCEREDADVLLAVRYIEWWTLEEMPSLYIPTERLYTAFQAARIRLDFVP